MIDFHCHLDLYPAPHAVVAACAGADIDVLSVTTTPQAWAGTLALAREAPRIYTALGLHPELAGQRKDEVRLFEQLLSEARFVGEIGLDGSPHLRSTWADQCEVFDRILRACERVGGRVMSIHSRRAAGPVLDYLGRSGRASIAVLHWFSGSMAELQQAIDLGSWFSVGLPMLTTAKGRSLVAAMPRDRILTETDGPFVRKAGRPAAPQDVIDALSALAMLWGTPLEITDQQIRANLMMLLGATSTSSQG